jgi:16S rRNA (uracil1498-N3)-methyltransferase
MRRFFIDEKLINRNRVTVKGPEAHHIKDVVRLKAGDYFIGLDGKGKAYTLRILETGKDIVARVEKVSLCKSDFPRTLLACAVPKKNKMDDIVEKAVQLGVTDIIPMITQRTIVKADFKTKTKKRLKWQKIVLEASKQSGRTDFAMVHDIVDFKDALEMTDNMGYDQRIIPFIKEGLGTIKDVLPKTITSVAVFIGPEGDFTQKEIDAAKRCGFKAVSLGPLVLKVDTACIFALSAISTASP